MKAEMPDYTTPVDQPQKRFCQPALGVLRTPTTARFAAFPVLWTAQRLASQGNEATLSGPSGDPARAGYLAAQARCSTSGASSIEQQSDHSGSVSRHDRIDMETTDRAAINRKEGASTLQPKRGREATHYPETATSTDVYGHSKRGEDHIFGCLVTRPRAKPQSVCTTVRRAEPQGETRNTGLPEPKRSAAKPSEQLSHRWSIYQRNGTGYAANRSLRAVHRWQRRCAKRPDNVPPRTRGPATVRKPVESASYNSGQGARLAGKVNVSEWPLNVVTRNKRK